MKFYLNSQEVRVEVAPIITETLDVSLDSATVTLEAMSSSNPIAPHQKFDIELDDGSYIHFLTSSDQVSLFSLNPETYKHTLGLIQTSKETSYHIVRNSVFSQPSNPYKELSHHITIRLGEANYNSNTQRTSSDYERMCEQKINFIKEPKEKIKKVYAELDVWAVIKNADDDTNGIMHKINNIDELNSLCNNTINYNISTTGNCVLSYTDSNNNAHYKNVKIGSLFHTKYEQQQDVASFLNHNYEININFDWIDSLSPRRVYPEESKTAMFIIFNLKITVETYYNTVYDILNLLKERQKQSRDGFSKAELFSLPTNDSNSALYELLTTTVAPNFTFTQCSMYECIAEVFNLFDSIFTLKGQNNELDIEYLNERNREPITKDFSGINIAITENERVNGLISNYQNAKKTIIFPSESGMAYVRSSELGVPAASDHHFLVEHNIDTINKCEVRISKCSIPTGYPQAGSYMVVTGNWDLDITRYVIDESLWSTLPKNDTFPYGGDYRNVVQNNSVYFAKGDNKIQIAATMQTRFGITYYCLYQAVTSAFHLFLGDNTAPADPHTPYLITPDFKGKWKDISFRLNYVSILNGRSKIESPAFKYDGDILIDQKNGNIDLNKMGLNMLGVSLKMGEPTLNVVHEISSWSGRIKKGQILNYNGSEWIANICSYTFLDNSHIKGEISFTKNFNNLATRIKLLREKRLSNISNELTIESEDNIIEYCHFSTQDALFLTNKEGASIKPFVLTSLLGNTFDYNNYTTKTKISSCYQLVSKSVLSITPTYYLYVGYRIPMIKYGAGNCLCFEAKYKSPISAGNNTDVSTGWFGTDKYFTNAQYYTDNYGFLDTISVGFDDISYEPMRGPSQAWTRSISESTNAPYIAIDNLQIYKQPNEIFALNYELCFLPNDVTIDFVGSEFINNNYLMNDENINKKFYIYYSEADDDFKYSIIDTKGHVGNSEEITSIAITNIETNLFALIFNFNEISNVNSWAICDEQGNIYFASNNTQDKNNTITNKKIYFSLSRYRT